MRKAIKEFVEKPKVKKVLRRREIKKNPFMDMAGRIKGGLDLASGVDEIYEDV